MARSRGFTLVELMVAVAVIAVLALMGITSYRNSRYEAGFAVMRQDALRAAAAAEAHLNRGGVLSTVEYTMTAHSGLGFTPTQSVYWGIYYVAPSGLAGTVFTRYMEMFYDGYCYTGINSEPSRVICFEVRSDGALIQRN